MTLPIPEGSNFKLNIEVPLLDLELLIYAHALFMEHDHPSYAHINMPDVTHTHWVKFESNVFAQILHHCGVSSLKTQLTK